MDAYLLRVLVVPSSLVMMALTLLPAVSALLPVLGTDPLVSLSVSTPAPVSE